MHRRTGWGNVNAVSEPIHHPERGYYSYIMFLKEVKRGQTEIIMYLKEKVAAAA